MEADNNGWLKDAIKSLRNDKLGRYADLAELASELSDDDVLSDDGLLGGEYRETDGMAGGAGCSVFSSVPAEDWVRSESEGLTAALSIIRNEAARVAALTLDRRGGTEH